MSEFLLPDVGEGLTEAELVSWKVKEGDTVEINEIICEIETAKSIVELPSPFAGTVLALMVAEGQTVDVGTPIISIGDAAPPAMEIDLSNPAASGGGEGESLVGRNKADRGPQRRARKGAASPASQAGAQAQLQVQGAFAPGGAQSQPVAPADEPPVPAESAAPEPVPTLTAALRALAKPPVRKLAKELGIDLSTLTPSGPRGTVSRDDVRAASVSLSAGHGGGADVGEALPETARERREPVKGVRRAMAQAMTRSAFTSPHVTEWVTVDVSATMRFLERLKTQRDFAGVRVSPTLVAARAAMLAMRRTPEINSWWDEEAQEVVYKSYVNLGIAAATPRGLVVPTIKDADSLSLLELAEALGELTATAREGRTQPAQMSGGTFTLTNVGVFGVDAGTPIINPGESAILCLGAVGKRPWVDEETGEIVARDVTTLALSFDHRHIDGEKGSRFLADVAGILRDPASALLF
ncbi:dihydrolipoamide acetyltransferase family protein [Nocardioides campestrisoli]|uniref:dihydrolipoamide acetyltransferase family protein n=1 Tax=Nocardioides campestrisoli TaxID=2736757 RepID=UPI00163D601B|nr:dihydrolipoamide acetyltransferase family protein [Nocardioides campestrisoli]